MTDHLRIAAVQMNPTVGDVVGNTVKILATWRDSQAKGVDLVVTTELSLLGYSPEDLVRKPDLLAECAEAIDLIAAVTRDGSPLIIGAPIVEKGVVYNAAVLLEGGRVNQIMKKHDLPNYGVFDDKRLFGAGHEQTPISIKGTKIGVMICEDTWFPDVAAALKNQGAEMLISINGSPYEYDKEKTTRMEALRARNAETGLPLLYVNQVGGQDGVVYDGHSMALNTGSVLAWSAPGWTEHTGLVEASRTNGTWALAGEKHVWATGLTQLYQALVLGTRDYIRKNGFKKVVIGLSGGADSALVAVIAADAIGAENVSCVRLPSAFTSRDSMDDAEALAQNIGCSLTTIPITAATQTVADELTKAFGGTLGDLTGQNIQARLRGLFLMGITNQYPRHLLLTTGNKSEMSVGYATLYGDMSGGFNPIKDVYKTTVFELMQWRNHNRPDGLLAPTGAIIPQNIIDKKPSAELKAGQSDESELGRYPILDAVLNHLIERETPLGEIITQGFDPDYVTKISDMLDRAEYKRRQAAPGVKVTSRALFGDRRYPITNGFRSSYRLGQPFPIRMQQRGWTL